VPTAGLPHLTGELPRFPGSVRIQGSTDLPGRGHHAQANFSWQRVCEGPRHSPLQRVCEGGGKLSLAPPELYSTLRYSTLLYSTLLYSTLLYSTLLYATLLYSTLLYSTLFYSALLCSTLPYPTVLYSTLLYSTLL
jgi:hypothetical protein